MKNILTGVAIATTAFMAQAEGFYLGAGIGFANVNDTTANTSSQLVSLLGGTARTTMDSSVNNMNENVAIEVGYMNTSNFSMNASGISGGNVSYTASGKATFSGLDASAVIRPSISSGYSNFFATVGMHNYKTKTSVSFTGGGQSFSTNDSKSGNGVMFGAGYDMKIDKDIDLRFSITRINKVSGEANDDATNYGIGLIKHF